MDEYDYEYSLPPIRTHSDLGVVANGGPSIPPPHHPHHHPSNHFFDDDSASPRGFRSSHHHIHSLPSITPPEEVGSFYSRAASVSGMSMSMSAHGSGGGGGGRVAAGTTTAGGMVLPKLPSALAPHRLSFVQPARRQASMTPSVAADGDSDDDYELERKSKKKKGKKVDMACHFCRRTLIFTATHSPSDRNCLHPFLF